MKSSISLIVLFFVAISMARPQFGGNNQSSQNQQQGFPNLIGNQNPFLPGNEGFGLQGEFGNQQGFGNQQPSFGQFNSNNNQQQGNNPFLPNQGISQNQQQSTTTAPPASSSSSSVVGTPAYVLCNQNCVSVNQYNPVCGSDEITYNNQFRLDCANQCGRQLDRNWQVITIDRPRSCISGQRVA